MYFIKLELGVKASVTLRNLKNGCKKAILLMSLKARSSNRNDEECGNYLQI